MTRVLELFAGIGACSKALENLGVECEIVDAVEIDKYAIRSFNAIHGTRFEPQDITQWNKEWYCPCCHKILGSSEVALHSEDFGWHCRHCSSLVYSSQIDLITHGSPCQDFSVAGLQKGGDEGSGTRSSLMYETIRIVSKLRPKYVLWENVKNILSKKHVHNFHAYLEAMTQLGYKSEYKVLNAKDFGVPQNRERVFTVSIRRDIAGEHGFNFPLVKLPVPKLSSVLESVVDEKYYLSGEKMAKFKVTNEKSSIMGNLNYYNYDKMNRVYAEDSISPTIETLTGGNRQPKVAIRTATKKGYGEATEGDSVNLAYPESKTRRGRVGHSVCQALTTGNSMGVVDSSLRVRKLTPRECWRLMGFSDEDFDKAAAVNSNTQLTNRPATLS